jgi:predicted amidophosphoribosyltransferase
MNIVRVRVANDIITTGSTISECGRILKQHGAAKVFAASVGLAE